MAEQLSGQVEVSSAGSAVRLPDAQGLRFLLRAASTNEGLIFVGNNGSNDVAATTGFSMSPGDTVPYGGALRSLFVDAENDGGRIEWFRAE